MTANTTNRLELQSKLKNPDRVYRGIVEAHRGLDEADSAALNAALVLILSNQIGDDELVFQALALAREALRSKPLGATPGSI